MDTTLAKQVQATVTDPTLFASKFFKDQLWGKQNEMLRAIAKPHASVAVKGCHASAKTHGAARAALWFVTRYPDGIVVTTAPKEDQLELLLWKEIRAAIRQSRIKYPEPLTTALKLSEANYVVALVAKDATRFQGFHAPHLLFILEEAPGVEPHIWEAIEGARAGGDVRILALGNPTIASGPYYDAFTVNRHRWDTVTISAFDTPNLEGVTLEQVLAMTPEELAINPAPYLTQRWWVKEKHQEWGPGHPLWEGRVLGQFPTHDEFALIPLAWIERATAPMLDTGAGGLHAGLDVAGPGEDETVLVIRSGPQIVAEYVWSQPDPRGAVKAKLREYYHRLERISVDSVGIGYYFAQEIRDMFEGNVHCFVDFVNVGEAPADKEKFKNRKAELYWGLRLRFEAGDIRGVKEPPMFGREDERLIGQLSGLRYKHNARGQIEIESKEDARKRGVRSPDRAEALMLAFAAPASGPGIRASNLSERPRTRADFSEVA